MVSSNINDGYSLSIGSKEGELSILQKKFGEDQSFFVADVDHHYKKGVGHLLKYNLSTKTNYFNVEKDFLKATHKLLKKPEDRKRFETLLV